MEIDEEEVKCVIKQKNYDIFFYMQKENYILSKCEC